MSDEKKSSENAGGEGSPAAPDASIPEVEAEIVEDPAMREGDLLKEAAPDDETVQGVSKNNADEAAAPPTKPNTPGVAIFAIFAIVALVIVAYWVWQIRSSGVQGASATSVEAQDQSEPEQSAETANIISAPLETASEEVSDQDVVAAVVAPEPVSISPVEEEAIAIVSDSLQPDVEPVDGLLSPAEEPLSLPIEPLAEGDSPESAPPAEEVSSIDNVEDEVSVEEAPATTESRDAAQNAAEPEDTAAVDANQNDQAVAEAVLDEGAAPEETPIDSVAAITATEQIPGDQVETVNEEFSLAIEQLSADLEAEREKSKALEAEMTSLRLAFEQEDASRAAEADATIAALRAELEAAQRALEERPETANAATAALTNLTNAVETGEPFSMELDAVAAFARDDAALASLRLRAAEGVPTRQELKESFREPARKAMAAVAQEQAEGPLDNLTARMKSVISIRPANALPGDSPRAVMSRVEDAVRRDAFTLAISQISALPQVAQVELQAWVMAAQEHEDVRRGLTELSSVVLSQVVR